MPVSLAQALFESQVERTPHATAVASAEGTLTYRELNSCANRLARELMDLGVGPEMIVGVYMRRCPELMIALLGILKAGGAFLPLDPEYPPARISYMLEDAGSPVLLTHAPLLDQLPAHEAKVISIDRSALLATGSADNPALRGDGDSLAYLMYTSGSTGRPKGILVPQRGLVNYLTWCLTTFPLAEGTCVPVHSSIAFDLTLTSLFVPLLAGKTLLMLGTGNALDLLRDAFLDETWRGEMSFCFIKITPVHLELLGHVLQPDQVRGRTSAFIIGGENLTDRHIAFWHKFSPNTQLVNEYGPTETVVGCCAYFLPDGPMPAGSVPIGKPIAGTQLHILDANMRPRAEGEVGELYIGGAGVARGYHNRPDLTAERFVPDPFGEEPGARLYRSGDLVHRLADGNLEFLGRIDGQINLRGFRIETEEVEGALQQHPVVRRALVLVRADNPGKERLAGYILPGPGEIPAVDDLKEFLFARVPAYMVPHDFIFLDAFPLTLNGKIDRKALPAPSRLKTGSDSAESRGSADELMRKIWEEVLEVGTIGVSDNFFDLGGDSLQAVRLISRIRAIFGCELPLSSLVQAPTIPGLTNLIRSDLPRSVSVIPLQTGGRGLPFFCFPGAGSDVFSLRELASELGRKQPFYGIQWLEESGEPRAPTLSHYASRYLEAIRRIQPEGPYYLGGYSFGSLVAYEAACQLVREGQEVAALVVIDHPACHQKAAWAEVIKDLPRWVRHDLTRLTPGYLLASLARRIARWTRLDRNRSGTAEPDSEPQPSTTPLFDYHLRLLSNYVPERYTGSIELLRTSSQRGSPLFKALFSGRDLSWSRLAAGGVNVRFVSGSHDTILKRPVAIEVAAHLKNCLARAAGRFSVPIECNPVSGRPTVELPSQNEVGTDVWRVVGNTRGQYSLWPEDQPRPAGWQDAGPPGTREQCLDYIREHWRDLRPGCAIAAKRSQSSGAGSALISSPASSC